VSACERNGPALCAFPQNRPRLTFGIFVPQSYDWGVEGRLTGTKPMPISPENEQAVSAFRCAAWQVPHFSWVFLQATQQRSWKDTNEPSPYFGGVFHRLRYDNFALRSKEDPTGGGAQRGPTEKRRHAFPSVPLARKQFCSRGKAMRKAG